MVRTAIYGGSFNPPHCGHAMVASWLLWTGRADEVWLLPTFTHPFDKGLAPFPRRVDLCRALAGSLPPGVSVCEIEGSLPTPSFTYHTLVELSARHPDRRFRLVVGADVIPELPRWHRWDDLAHAFDPIVVGRQGYPTPPGALDFPEVSSTDIRARLAAHEPVDHLVPRAVLERLGGLYGP